MQIPPGSYSFVSFGGLAVEPDAAQLSLPDPEQYRVYKWELNPHRREMRLGISHRGAIWYFRLSDGDAFGHRFYDIVASSWRDEHRDEEQDTWYPWFCRRDDLSAAMIEAEREIFVTAVGTLPDLMEQVKTRTGVPIEGAMFINDLKAGVNGPEATFRADYFREVIVDQLQTLLEDDYPSVPRIDVSAIKGWSAECSYNNVWTCFIKLPDRAGEQLYILKARKLPSFLQADGWTSEDRDNSDRLSQGELKVLTEMPPHPNVFPAPLALVTVVVDSPDQGKMASGEGKPQSQTTKLVGWVADYIDESWQLIEGPLTAAKANRVMGLAVDLSRGAQHLAANGFFHPDLCFRNTLSRIVRDPNSKFAYHSLIVMDFEPIARYQNSDGPPAPEAMGEWRARVDQSGHLLYDGGNERSKEHLHTIYADLAQLPEARERLLVFDVGCTLAHILKVRIHIAGTDLSACDPEVSDYVVVEPVNVGQDPERDAWEDLFPLEVRTVIQQCVSYNPLERPLLADIVKIMNNLYIRLDTGIESVAAFAP
ncbi:hypothetical protein V8E36_009446 [Tilletia maclaganii]